MSVLLDILSVKREEVARGKQALSASALDAAARSAPPVRPFAGALRDAPGCAVIAEIKKASPSKGIIRKDFDPDLDRAVLRGGWRRLPVRTDRSGVLPRPCGSSAGSAQGHVASRAQEGLQCRSLAGDRSAVAGCRLHSDHPVRRGRHLRRGACGRCRERGAWTPSSKRMTSGRLIAPTGWTPASYRHQQPQPQDLSHRSGQFRTPRTSCRGRTPRRGVRDRLERRRATT